MRPTTFGPSKKTQAKELHINIVHSLFELAKKITVVEKF
jgi:hypothetical protein